MSLYYSSPAAFFALRDRYTSIEFKIKLEKSLTNKKVARSWLERMVTSNSFDHNGTGGQTFPISLPDSCSDLFQVMTWFARMPMATQRVPRLLADPTLALNRTLFSIFSDARVKACFVWSLFYRFHQCSSNFKNIIKDKYRLITLGLGPWDCTPIVQSGVWILGSGVYSSHWILGFSIN